MRGGKRNAGKNGEAAAGRSSKDIAERMYLSPRTVENHLDRGYIKLGVTDRDGLAAALESARTPA